MSRATRAGDGGSCGDMKDIKLARDLQRRAPAIEVHAFREHGAVEPPARREEASGGAGGEHSNKRR
jgi:hypothetical protein